MLAGEQLTLSVVSRADSCVISLCHPSLDAAVSQASAAASAAFLSLNVSARHEGALLFRQYCASICPL